MAQILTPGPFGERGEILSTNREVAKMHREWGTGCEEANEGLKRNLRPNINTESKQSLKSSQCHQPTRSSDSGGNGGLSAQPVPA